MRRNPDKAWKPYPSNPNRVQRAYTPRNGYLRVESHVSNSQFRNHRINDSAPDGEMSRMYDYHHELKAAGPRKLYLINHSGVHISLAEDHNGRSISLQKDFTGASLHLGYSHGDLSAAGFYHYPEPSAVSAVYNSEMDVVGVQFPQFGEGEYFGLFLILGQNLQPTMAQVKTYEHFRGTFERVAELDLAEPREFIVNDLTYNAHITEGSLRFKVATPRGNSIQTQPPTSVDLDKFRKLITPRDPLKWEQAYQEVDAFI